MAKKLSHIVKRHGRTPADHDVEIPVAEDLASVPGIPMREDDVSFYSRTEPIEVNSIENSADRDWAWTVYTPDVHSYLEGHYARMKPLIEKAASSADIEPTAQPEPGRDVTEDIRTMARSLGFGEVGFTRLDRRHVYKAKKQWAKYPHAICLAYEQDYESTQTLPSLAAEEAHYGTYEIETALGFDLADYIRDLGYRAQVYHPLDGSAVLIPMFVSAGLGQLGANGQLLSPHFGSRARLMMITTDAQVKHDEPQDYGIHNFCQKCQVCVNRCPARALVKEKVWYRGVEKNKVSYDRCRPVMARYEGCGVCMKVCPIQKFGMMAVMEHCVATGGILGKGTEALEGYSLRDKGHFGPGEMPHFAREVFDFPRGRREDHLLQQFKKKVSAGDVPSPDELIDFAETLREALDKSGEISEE
mgnify:CR=1 FL=1